MCHIQNCYEDWGLAGFHNHHNNSIMIYSITFISNNIDCIYASKNKKQSKNTVINKDNLQVHFLNIEWYYSTANEHS